MPDDYWATTTRTRLVRNFIDGYIDRKRSFISKRVGPRPRLFKILIRRPNVARSAQNTREIRKACKRDKVVSERVADLERSPTKTFSKSDLILLQGSATQVRRIVDVLPFRLTVADNTIKWVGEFCWVQRLTLMLHRQGLG
jgi:hypothetical protein